jgi:hypothetical protein
MEKRAPDPRDESNREDSIKYRRLQIENLQQSQVNTQTMLTFLYQQKLFRAVLDFNLILLQLILI